MMDHKDRWANKLRPQHHRRHVVRPAYASRFASRRTWSR